MEIAGHYRLLRKIPVYRDLYEKVAEIAKHSHFVFANCRYSQIVERTVVFLFPRFWFYPFVLVVLYLLHESLISLHQPVLKTLIPGYIEAVIRHVDEAEANVPIGGFKHQ